MTGLIPDPFTRSILTIDANGFTVQDAFSKGITRQGKWACHNGTLTALDPTGGSNTANGNSQNMDAKFKSTSASGVTLPATLTPSDTWIQAVTLEGIENIAGNQVPDKNEFSNPCKVISMESVTAAAGTFNAARFDCTTSMMITITMINVPIQALVNFSASKWYAKHVGLVKTVTTGNNPDSTIELTAHNIL